VFPINVPSVLPPELGSCLEVQGACNVTEAGEELKPCASVTTSEKLYAPERSGVKVGVAALVLESAAALPEGAAVWLQL
jgi:hypothetical protein